jgi:hypothetical protein
VKLYISIIIPVIVLCAVLVGGYVLSPAMEPPQLKLNEQVGAKVELAQRLLSQYNAAAPRLERAFAAAATQPENIEAEKWQGFRDQEGEKSPFAFVKERLSSQGQQIDNVSRAIADASGEEAKRTELPGAAEAYRGLLDSVKSNQELLDQALGAVREATGLSMGEGENAAQGGDHPVATRLEAVLIHHKADLMRRQAALLRSDAASSRDQFERALASCRDLDEELQAQKVLLAGGNAPGKGAVAVANTEAQAAPASEPADAAKPDKAAKAAKPDKAAKSGKAADADKATKADKTAKSEKASKSTDSGSLIGELAKRAQGLLGKPEGKSAKSDSKKAAKSEVEQAAAEPARPDALKPRKAEKAEQAEKPEKAEPAAEPVAEPGPAESVPPLADRIAELKKIRSEADAVGQSAQADADRLTKQIEDLNGRIAAARQKAHEAEVKMIEAERNGVKADEYRKLSETYRQASREAASLEQGAVRNAKPAVDDPDEIIQAPLVAADSAKPMEPERGRVALEADLATAKATVETSKTLLAEIDRQVADLSARRDAVEARVKRLEEQRQKMVADAATYGNAAMIDVLRADQLEAQALDLASGAGAQAAKRAQAAATKYQSQMSQFIRSENPAELPERKLTEMAGDQFTTANATLVGGDLNYLVARIYAQQAVDLKCHQQFIADAQSAGASPKLDPKSLPEGVQAEAVPEYLTNPEKLPQVIKDDETKASEAAKQALDAYTQAAGQLKDLWVVYTNIAAVHRMMADLPKLANDNDDHAALARQTYARAIQGREKRPDYNVYRRAAESLVVAKPAAAEKR